MDIQEVKPPHMFKYFNRPVTIHKHYTFKCDNRIFFSDTAFKDLKNHRYSFNLEIQSHVGDLGLATDFHLIDKIYNDYISVKLNNCLINQTLPDMNTTAENIAYWIFEQFNKHLPAEDVLQSVTLYETDNQGITVTK